MKLGTGKFTPIGENDTMSEQTSNRAEIIIFAVIVAVVALAMAVSAFGEEIGLAIMLIGVALAVWLFVWLAGWLWRFVGNTNHDWADRTQARALQAATVQTQLLLECKRAELVHAIDGVMPIAHAAIVSGEYNKPLLELAARRIDTLAPMPNVPQTLTYSPHISQKSEVGEIPEMPHASSILPAGDFYSLFMAGKLPKDKLFIGPSLDDGSEVTATWRNLYSTLIGGLSGMGKSTLVRSLLAQSAMQGGKFVIIDPHYGSGEESLGESLQPLRKLMLCDVASSEKEMVSALKFVADIGQRRLSGEDKDRTPIILVVDETTGLLSRSAVAGELIDVLGAIAQETRKVGLFSLAIGQNFSSKIMPTEVRNSFVSFISCRARRDVARVQTSIPEFGDVAASLAPFQAVWLDPSGEMHKFSIPNCTEKHLQSVAQTLTVNASEEPVVEPVQKAITASADYIDLTGTSTGTSTGSFTANERRIMQMFQSGASVGDIAVEVLGAKKGSGNGFVKACDEVQATIRKFSVQFNFSN